MAVLTFDGLATPGQCLAPDWVAVPAAGPRTRPGSYNSQLVLCSAPSVPQPVFTITEKAPSRAFPNVKKTQTQKS